MSEKFPLKGCIYEVNFGYNANLDGYTTLMPYIPKLSASKVLSSRGFMSHLNHTQPNHATLTSPVQKYLCGEIIYGRARYY